MSLDRISEILENHIEIARKQLALAKRGILLSSIEAETTGLPSTEDELLIHIANLEGSLARHKALNT